MNKHNFPAKFENEYVEAEIVGKKENITIEKKDLFNIILKKLGKMAFFLFLTVGFLLIFLGSVLCATVIGAIIGVPLIVFGIILLIIGVKVYFSIIYKRIY